MINQIKHLNILDYLVVLLYMLMLSGVGIYLTKFNKTVDDFFKGGGKTPWWLAGLSTFVSGFTAFMFVAATGHTYKMASRQWRFSPRRFGDIGWAILWMPKNGGAPVFPHRWSF